MAGTAKSDREISDSFTGTGASTNEPDISGVFNFTVYGAFVGTVALQKSVDDGVSFPINVVSLTAPECVLVTETEKGVRFRANCTAFTSGTINTRIGKD